MMIYGLRMKLQHLIINPFPNFHLIPNVKNCGFNKRSLGLRRSPQRRSSLRWKETITVGQLSVGRMFFFPRLENVYFFACRELFFTVHLWVQCGYSWWRPNETYSQGWSLVSPPKRASLEKHGDFDASPRRDMCQEPQQTAEMNTCHCVETQHPMARLIIHMFHGTQGGPPKSEEPSGSWGCLYMTICPRLWSCLSGRFSWTNLQLVSW